MFQTVHPNRWFFWAIVIPVITALLLLWAIAEFSIEQDYVFSGDEIFYQLRAKRKKIPGTGDSATTPRTELDCEERGGTWGFFGDTIVPRCNIRTADVGKACSDSSECQGACVATLSLQDKELLSSGQTLYMQGQCSATTLVLGCNYFVREGKAAPLSCTD